MTSPTQNTNCFDASYVWLHIEELTILARLSRVPRRFMLAGVLGLSRPELHCEVFCDGVVRDVFIQGQTKLELQYFDQRPTNI